jgi:recombination protein RecT
VVNLALIGTTLNPALAKAYLVPRKVHGTMLCCLDISYRGLAGIAMDSGSVKHLAPWLVYDFDHFDYRQEDGEVHIMHRPALNPPEDFIKNQPAAFWEHLVCGYMIATLHDGTKIISPPFAKWKLTKAMATSMTTSEKTPWRTHPDEMCLKTIIKHGYKLLPQTDRMSLAVSVLNEHEGLDLEAEKRARKKAGEDRFNEAEDAQWSEVGGEKVDTKTGEVKEEKPAKTGPDPCPSCKVDRKDGKCREKTCDLAIPSSEEVGELFGEKE